MAKYRIDLRLTSKSVKEWFKAAAFDHQVLIIRFDKKEMIFEAHPNRAYDYLRSMFQYDSDWTIDEMTAAFAIVVPEE